MNTNYLATESDTLNFAKRLALAIADGAIIFLSGPLGAGKTTFCRGFLQGLGYVGKVKSPTYTIVEPYEIAGRNIYHFDFYRLHDSSELEQIGIREYFSPSFICLIEWPEKGMPLLPEPDLACHIDISGVGREVRLKAHSSRGEAIMQLL